MEQNPDTNELDIIHVVEDTDDLVQILGVTPDEDAGEVEVTSVEFDNGDSFFINIDEDMSEGDDGFYETIDSNDNVLSDDSFGIEDSADAADVI